MELGRGLFGCSYYSSKWGDPEESPQRDKHAELSATQAPAPKEQEYTHSIRAFSKPSLPHSACAPGH